MTRRGFLAQWVIGAAQARALSAWQPADLFDIERAADGVWIALAKPAVLLNCNAVVFELSDGLLVVDSHSKPSAAAALVAQLRRDVTKKPVRWLVNTHFHYDHAHGNGAYRGTRIIAHAATRELLLKARFEGSIESMQRTVENARRRLEMGSAEARAYHRRVVAEGEAYIREMRNLKPELPDVVFDGEMRIFDSRQDLHFLFRGRGHTGSDICVYSPSRRVLATGDLAVGFIPGMGDGYPLEWPATLEAFAQLEIARVLPGHGEMQEGLSRYRELQSYIGEVIEVAQSGVSVDIENLRTLRRDRWGGYVAAMTSRFRLLAPGSDPWDMIAAGVRGNVEAIRKAAG